MNDIVSRIQSPCIRNCCLNEDDVCLGCFRRIDEITRWNDADDSERRLILSRAQERKSAHDKRFGKYWTGLG